MGRDRKQTHKCLGISLMLCIRNTTLRPTTHGVLNTYVFFLAWGINRHLEECSLLPIYSVY